MQLTQEQQNVIDHVMNELDKCGMQRYYTTRTTFETTVGGFAGVGKSTLVSYLREEIAKKYPKAIVAFTAFTGKAASVLNTKLVQTSSKMRNDYVGTIHGLIYKAVTEWDYNLKTHVIVGWKLKSDDEMYEDIIIVDEASMVSEQIYNDLKKFNKPLIFIGDHGQLPPIDDNFGLMKSPQFVLNTIHRQALNSPIIQLSQFVRNYGYIPKNKIFSQDVFKLSWDHPKCKEIWNKITFDENIITLCGFNTTRCNLNKLIRSKNNFDENVLPYPGERIVCLQNDHTRGIMNGQIGTVRWVAYESHKLFILTLEMDGFTDPIETTVDLSCFGKEKYTMYDKSVEKKIKDKYAISKGINPIAYFDYGYAMSVHKSQSSSWEKVVVFEQRSKFWDDEFFAKWLYTAITRAEKKLFIISDYWG